MIRELPTKTYKATQELLGVTEDLVDAAVTLYSYELDGERVKLLRYNKQTKRLETVNWHGDPIFFCTVKSEFIKRDQEKNRIETALRPEDV